MLSMPATSRMRSSNGVGVRALVGERAPGYSCWSAPAGIMNDPSYIEPLWIMPSGLRPETHAIEQSSMLVEVGVGIRCCVDTGSCAQVVFHRSQATRSPRAYPINGGEHPL